MTAEWGTTYCRYQAVLPDIEGPPGQVKVTLLDYLCTQTVEEITGESTGYRSGRVDLSDENRVYTLPALENVPEHVMTGWILDALGPEAVAALEEDAIPDPPVIDIDPPTGGFDPGAEENEES